MSVKTVKWQMRSMLLLLLLLIKVLYIAHANLSGIVRIDIIYGGVSTKTSPSLTEDVEVSLDYSTNEDYFYWLQHQRNKSTSLMKEQPLNLRFHCMAGLGHQLHRLSAAYHLAMTYKIPYIWPTTNPICWGNIFTIYDRLIGEGPLLVDVPFFSNNMFHNHTLVPLCHDWPKLVMVNETNMTNGGGDESSVHFNRDLNINNEVPGYGDFLGASNLEALLSNNFYGKDLSDYQLYHQLMVLFEHKLRQKINNVLNHTRFEQHTVFVLHVQTGNGEFTDSKLQRRQTNNLNQWIIYTIQLLCDYKKHYTEKYFSTKPLMIYVGTDTGSVIAKLQNASQNSCKIPIVSADQAYIEEGKGHSGQQKYMDEEKEVCLQGQIDAFLDMHMFTRCNTVVAGSYSSFSQAAPLSMVLHRARFGKKYEKIHPHYFCEMGINGTRLDCFDMFEGWLQRKPVLVWGDPEAPNQKFINAFKFPNNYDHPIEILQLFMGTVMMEENWKY